MNGHGEKVTEKSPSHDLKKIKGYGINVSEKCQSVKRYLNMEWMSQRKTRSSYDIWDWWRDIEYMLKSKSPLITSSNINDRLDIEKGHRKENRISCNIQRTYLDMEWMSLRKKFVSWF